jgi:hypothetical protein
MLKLFKLVQNLNQLLSKMYQFDNSIQINKKKNVVLTTEEENVYINYIFNNVWRAFLAV